MIRIPKQLEASEVMVRSWSFDHPRFYGEKAVNEFVDCLLETEQRLHAGEKFGLDPRICRVLAAFYGPKGAKVPLALASVSGCIRPGFVALNPWLQPNTPSCYDGGCYLYHARAVPAKKSSNYSVRAHIQKQNSLIAAAKLARVFSTPIRDNQSSDGSFSMSLPVRMTKEPQLVTNLRTLCDSGYTDVPYLCFSAAYCQVPEDNLRLLSDYPNLFVHVTISGWHSIEENLLRLREFERYSVFLPNTYLRVVNRKDWAGFGDAVTDSGARCEQWLLSQIEERGLSKYVIRTPFHSIHPFPGSRTSNLGSRHMAGTEYYQAWGRVLDAAEGECCTTGKCKTCPTRCGANKLPRIAPKPIVAARAFDVMLRWEIGRQRKEGISPLGLYTARIIARKAAEQYACATERKKSLELKIIYERLNKECAEMNITKLQRRRLANDSHALVVDGIDRHGLWQNRS